MNIIFVLIVVWTAATTAEFLTEEELKDFNRWTTTILDPEGLTKPLTHFIGGIDKLKQNFQYARNEALNSVDEYNRNEKDFWLRLSKFSATSNYVETEDNRIQDDVEPVEDSTAQKNFLKQTHLNYSYHLVKPKKWEISPTSIPKTVDWRLKNGVRRSVDYHHSCYASYPWAVSATLYAHESYWENIPQSQDPPSAQQFIDCPYDNDLKYKSYNPCKDHRHGFNGSPDSVVRAYKFAVLNGYMKTSSYPYKNGERSVCRLNKASSDKNILGYVHIKNDKRSDIKLMVAVGLYGPVTVSFESTHKNLELRRYGGGIFDEPCGKGKLYTMVVIGYGEENGKQYFLLLNNQGNNWGIHGLIKIARHTVAGCNIFQQMLFPIYHKDYSIDAAFDYWNKWRRHELSEHFKDTSAETFKDMQVNVTPSIWI